MATAPNMSIRQAQATTIRPALSTHQAQATDLNPDMDPDTERHRPN